MLINTDSIAEALNMRPIGILEIDTEGATEGWGGGRGEFNAFFGKKHTEETKQTIREAKTGSSHRPATKEKMSKTRIGRSHSESHKKSISESRKGMVFTTEHRENLRRSHLGNKNSEETCKKISAALNGRKLTDAHRAAIRAAWAKRKESSSA
jgi:hypothetical protein